MSLLQPQGWGGCTPNCMYPLALGDTWQNQRALNLPEMQRSDLSRLYYRKVLLVLIKHGVAGTLHRQTGLVFFFKLYL